MPRTKRRCWSGDHERYSSRRRRELRSVRLRTHPSRGSKSTKQWSHVRSRQNGVRQRRLHRAMRLKLTRSMRAQRPFKCFGLRSSAKGQCLRRFRLPSSLLRPDVPTLAKQPGTHRVFASRAESTPPARPAASLPPPRIAAPNTTRTEPWPAPTEPGRLRPRVRHEDRPLLSSPPVRPPKDRTSGNTQAPIRNAFQPFARPAPAPAVVMAKARAATRLSPPVAVEGAASPITISIGRVDVRADAPPLRPGLRGAKPAGPRLQLEDYLNERSRGAR